ncbi:GlxA family transcriptional regulator [Cupriavidus pampae]|uniref:HTH-type transcriptional regulator CdhR n=1 Tax=Cupriavidus pampae TaxID=659251 RepID=A0ABN7YCQ9_9BURK|nr:GlxA family transcriptional regulator [Cupriavidus pampae]CAG9171234.1 HTH-type transcriptional regulator CdhR [Cupriavidus pampae]
MSILPPSAPVLPRRILFVAFQRFGLLDLSGPQTVFWCANLFAQERGLPGYDCHTVSIGGGAVRSVEGVVVQTDDAETFPARDVDTIIVPGTPDILDVVDASGALVHWLRQSAANVRRTASVCTGAFFLAEAGLLHGRRATTHWINIDDLAARFPTLTVDRNAIFVQQDPVWTSAGVTAGIDLALALVEADLGYDIALGVARQLVVYLKRPAEQPQFSEMLKAQSRDTPAFDALHLWILDNLGDEALTVDRMAARVNMSPRNFARAYKEKIGRTPAKAVEHFRLEAACRLLRGSGRSIDQIAHACGFGDEERMRVTFRRHMGLSPSEYRQDGVVAPSVSITAQR